MIVDHLWVVLALCLGSINLVMGIGYTIMKGSSFSDLSSFSRVELKASSLATTPTEEQLYNVSSPYANLVRVFLSMEYMAALVAGMTAI